MGKKRGVRKFGKFIVSVGTLRANDFQSFRFLEALGIIRVLFLWVIDNLVDTVVYPFIRCEQLKDFKFRGYSEKSLKVFITCLRHQTAA